MTDTSVQVNGTSIPLQAQQPVSVQIPPEIESTLSRLSAYRSVRGVMVLSRTPSTSASTSSSAGSIGGIVQSTGSVFEGEGGQKYASLVESLVAVAAKGVGECEEGDELKLMRMRTKRHEMIITPDERYILVVLQDPGQ